jgi:malate synthase
VVSRTSGATETASSPSPRIDAAGLAVAASLYDFVENEALPGTGVSSERFWAGAAEIIRELAPRNRALLARRDDLQGRLDDYPS